MLLSLVTGSSVGGQQHGPTSRPPSQKTISPLGLGPSSTARRGGSVSPQATSANARNRPQTIERIGTRKGLPGPPCWQRHPGGGRGQAAGGTPGWATAGRLDWDVGGCIDG